MLGSIVETGLNILDRVISDPVEREKAKLELLKQQQEGRFKEIDASMAVLLAAAKSSDKWISRARPTFLYVMYTHLLAGIPVGFLYAYDPALAKAVIAGYASWLASIPEALYETFTFCFSVYVAGRSFDKYGALKNKANKSISDFFK